jgi:Mor family transcriptional regulator
MIKLPRAITTNREAFTQLFERWYFQFGPIAAELIIKGLLEELGGLRITVPSIRETEKESRNARIRARYTGSNSRELAEIFGLHRKQILKIVNKKNII